MIQKWGSDRAGRSVTYEIFATDYAGNIGRETFLFGQDNRNTITVDIIDPVIAQVSLNIPSKNIPIAKANDTVQLSYRVPHLLDIELATRVRFNGISEDTSSGTFDRSISYAVPSYRSYVQVLQNRIHQLLLIVPGV